MQKVIGALFAVLFILTLVTGARAQDLTEEIGIENGSLVVKKVQVVRTELERYPMPKLFDIPTQDISKIRDIMKQGAGGYVLEQNTEAVWQWGFPMQITTREVKTVAAFQNGTWLEPKVLVGPMTAKDSWLLTVLLVIIAIGVLAMSVAHQKSGKSEWWLAIFYGALIAMIGSFYMSGAIAIAFATIIAGAFAIIAIATIIAGAFATTIAIAFAIIAIATIATSATNNQIVEYAIFMACVIIVSYLLAKLAKRLGWIKVAELPAS